LLINYCGKKVEGGEEEELKEAMKNGYYIFWIPTNQKTEKCREKKCYSSVL
jgi:hypothetical protein